MKRVMQAVDLKYIYNLMHLHILLIFNVYQF